MSDYSQTWNVRTATSARAHMTEDRLETVTLVMINTHRRLTSDCDSVINAFCRNWCPSYKFRALHNLPDNTHRTRRQQRTRSASASAGQAASDANKVTDPPGTFCDDRRRSRLLLKMFNVPDVTVLSSSLLQLMVIRPEKK